MNCRIDVAIFTAIKLRQLRLLPLAMSVLVLAACASQPSDDDSLALLARGSNTVVHGSVSRTFPGSRRIVLNINRRIYMGNTEATAPNQTFGLAFDYGPNRFSPPATVPPQPAYYFKAVLATVDHHVLRCDFRHNDGGARDGLCVDDFGQVYDVVSSR